MHSEVLNNNQLKLLPLVKEYSREYYLAGGTAIALYLGHRRSIDFDLFKNSGIKPVSVINKISASGFAYSVTRRVSEQLDVSVEGVKMTFLQYPFHIPSNLKFNNYIKVPSLIHLAAMKAYALGRRSKWKVYVDLYFLLKRFSLQEISHVATEVFGELFSEKLFRAQLSFFDDIDYTEEVDYLNDQIPDVEIKSFLADKAIDFL